MPTSGPCLASPKSESFGLSSSSSSTFAALKSRNITCNAHKDDSQSDFGCEKKVTKRASMLHVALDCLLPSHCASRQVLVLPRGRFSPWLAMTKLEERCGRYGHRGPCLACTRTRVAVESPSRPHRRNTQSASPGRDYPQFPENEPPLSIHGAPASLIISIGSDCLTHDNQECVKGLCRT